MGCGCSMHNKRVAAQKEKDETTTVEPVEGAGQTPPPDELFNEPRSGRATPPPPAREREFLQGMSLPSSPVGIPSAPARDKGPPSPAAPEAAAAETTEIPSTAARSATEVGKGGIRAGAEGGVAAVPLVAPSNGGRQKGEALESPGAEKGGITTGESARHVEQLLQPVEPQGRIPRISCQEPLPRIAPSMRGSTDFPPILGRGGTLGPGLDVGFREEPVNITATEIADVPVSNGVSGGVGGGGNVSGNGKRTDDRPKPPLEAGQSAGVDAARNPDRKDSGGYNEVLLVTPVTPDDDAIEDVLSEHRAPVKDRWPRDDRDDSSSKIAGRNRREIRDDEDDPPPRQEARPALAAGAEAESSGGYGVRASLSVLDLFSEGDNDLSAASGGGDASADAGAWGASSGAYTLLDAEEEDFMETLLTES